MKTKIAGAILGFTIILLAGGAYFLYYYYKNFSNKPIASQEPLKEEPLIAPKMRVLPTGKDIIFPVTSNILKIDLVDKNTPKVANQILIQDLTDELLFCIREVLKDENIKFAYHQRAKIDSKSKPPITSIDLIIYPEDKKQRLVALLNYYGIPFSE